MAKRSPKKAPARITEQKPSSPPLDNNELTEDIIPRTYMGLLDDVMIRYSGDYASKEFFNRMIAKSIFFGDGMYINDGYLVNHATAREYLKNPHSLLSYMITTGDIQVLTRKGSPKELEDMPEEMAKSNPSFERLTTGPDWKEFKTKTLRGIARGIFRNRHNRDWPRWDASQGFTSLMRRVFSSNAIDVGLHQFTDDEFCRIFAEFLRREPWKSNARAKLEDAAVFVLTGLAKYTPEALPPKIRRKMANLMDLANQAYHYNFALSLTAEEDFGIAADTTIGKAFDELLQTHEIEEYTLKQIEGLDLFSLPEGLPYDDGSVFWEFMNPQSHAYAAKLNYLSTLNHLLSSNHLSIEQIKRNITDASVRYLDQIKTALRKKYNQIDKLFKEHELQQKKQQSMYLALGDAQKVLAAAAPTPVLAVKLQSSASRMDESFRTQRFNVKIVTEEFDGSSVNQGTTIKLKHIRPQLSAVAVTRAAALKHVRYLTDFSKKKDDEKPK